MKKNVLLFALFVVSMTSCKKSADAPSQAPSKKAFVLTGNYKPTAEELNKIATNLKLLSTLTADQQIELMKSLAGKQTTMTTSDTNRNPSLKIRDLTTTTTDYQPADYLSIVQGTSPDYPNESIYEYSDGLGTIYNYYWEIAYSAFHLFSIISSEKCELLDYGPNRPLGSQHGFNSITHNDSYLEGITGPASWTEHSQFQYFQPGLYTAYFNTSGSLSVAWIGSHAIGNDLYVNADQVAGLLPSN